MEQVLTLFIALLASVSVAFAPVNVNTATETELQSINGLGPEKAKAIVDYREKNGPFKSLEELAKVPGIDQGTLARIRNDVTLSGKAAVPTKAKGAEKKSTAEANARASPEDTSRRKAAQTTPGGIAKDGGEQSTDKKSAARGADPSAAPGFARETDTKTSQAN